MEIVPHHLTLACQKAKDAVFNAVLKHDTALSWNAGPQELQFLFNNVRASVHNYRMCVSALSGDYAGNSHY